MRVLIASIACHPTWGSEAYFGWAAVNALASKHELTVLTHAGSIQDIKHAAAQDEVLRGVRFIGVGQSVEWHPNRMLARLQSWRQYATWCSQAHETAAKLLQRENYDIGQHVTYSTWRQVSPLAGLGIPWIFGPVGGGEVVPPAFRKTLGLPSRLFELARDISTLFASHSPKLRRSIQTAAVVLTSTPETAHLLRNMGVSPERLRSASATFIHRDRIALFKCTQPRSQATRLRIFAGGNLEGRKGLAMALHALAAAKKRGVPFEFSFAGYGPELAHLKKLAARLKLDSNCVSFRNGLPLDEYRHVLKNSDIYLLPSLRESGGLTLGEAMLAGCVPIVVKAGGPGMLVTPECGYAFESVSPNHLVEQMTNALHDLWNSPERRAFLSNNAAIRAETYLSEDQYLEAIESAYETVSK